MVKNHAMAEQRVFMLLNRMRRDPQLGEQYDFEIAELLRNNYAERKSDAEIQWYLPHHPVKNPKKDRIRVVFDCRAKNKELGLNDVIMSGPNAINDLWNILLQFRTKKASSPFVACESLKKLIHHGKGLSDEQKTAVTKQFYVDDFVCCSDDPEYITSTVFAVREAI